MSETSLSDVSSLPELLIEVRNLDLSDNAISDISSLAEMTRLRVLKLPGNSVSDIAALASMTDLYALNLANNSISVIGPLADLKNLYYVDLSGNSISDVGPLGGPWEQHFMHLVDLSDNAISDVAPLRDIWLKTGSTDSASGFTGQQTGVLNLSDNDISDFGPLATTSVARKLDLSKNSISDLSPLTTTNFKSVAHLDLSDNLISDLGPISDGVTPLLNLANNAIIDITPLATYRQSALYLWGNSIEDISPLFQASNLRELYLTCCPEDITDEPRDTSNPLSAESVSTHIPQLQRQGVLVFYGPNDPDPANLADGVLRRSIILQLPNTGYHERSAFFDGAPITQAHMATLVEVSAQGLGITDLAGLEFAVNLTDVDLRDNTITNISQLSYMTELERLDLSYNDLVSVAHLAGLANLRELNLSANSVTNISPLTLLRSLVDLDLTSNRIDKIDALAGLTTLTDLRLASNLIRDVAPLLGLTELLHLDLSANRIEDIRPLSPLTKLVTLALDNNSIADIGPLAGLIALSELSLANNLISDIAPLAGLRGRLNLSGNLISDIEPLALPILSSNYGFVDLSFNRISNIEPVLDLYKYYRDIRSTLNLDLRGNPYDDQPLRRLRDLGAITGIVLDDDQFAAIETLIPDPVLRACIRRSRSFEYRDDDVPITSGDIRRLTSFGCRGRDGEPKISDLTGLQHFVRLEDLGLPNHSISDITVLSDLIEGGRLNELDLSGNAISDISALSGGLFTGTFDLSDNLISDISPIAEMRFEGERYNALPGEPQRTESLPDIDLSGNLISDLSPFADVRIPGPARGLTGILFYSSLDLSDNSISDISVLAQYELGLLDLSGNEISDISMTASIPIPARVLDLSNNAISDLSPLAGRTGLRILDLADNSISDLSPLAGTQFRTGTDRYSRSTLNLARNEISDVSVLAEITGVQRLDLSGNAISRVPALADRNFDALDLSHNEIQDLQFLTDVYFGLGTGSLNLSHNSISDLGPLASLGSSPSELYLAHNSISDMPPLANVEYADKLDGLYLSNNAISNLDGISDFVGLRGTLDLSNNMIADLQPLGELFSNPEHRYIEHLDLSHNQIVSLEPLRDVWVVRLYLWGNMITDLSPLFDLRYRAAIYLTCCPPDRPSGDRTASNPLSDESVDSLSNSRLLVYFETDPVVDIPDPNLRDALAEIYRSLLLGHNLSPPDGLITRSILGRGRLSTLELRDKGIANLSGLEYAVSLRFLDVSGNTISSLEPIAGLSDLERLDLSSNEISDLGALERLPHLQYLDLSHNSISDVAPLANLGPRTATVDGVETPVCGLGVLDLSHNDVSDVTPLADLGPHERVGNRFYDLPGLASLNLSSNAIFDIGPLKKLTALSVLDLSDNSIRNIEPLAAPSDGKYISYDLRIYGQIRSQCDAWQSYLKVDWGFGYVGGISSLRGFVGASLHSLDLSGNVIEDISPLSGQRILGYLDVSDNSISDIQPLSGLGPVTITAEERPGQYTRTLDVQGLWFAYVSDNDISDISPVATLQNLQVLDASSNSVSDLTALADTQALQHVNLSTNAISDISALANLRRLQTLDLSTNAISDITALSGLGPYRHGNRRHEGLQHLDLSDNKIMDISALAGLGPLTDADAFRYGGLVHLGLSRNAISDISPLAQLSSLERLYLADNAIADISPLARLFGLDELDLSNNWITNLQPLHDWARYFAARRYDVELSVDLSGNPLGSGAIISQLPSLRDVGVRIAGSFALPPRSPVESGSDTLIAAETKFTVPLFPSGSNALRHGFVRVINRSDRAGEVRIDPVDDSGRQYDRLTMAIGPDAAVHFNSLDLEMGSPAKGLVGNTGSGVGDWRLEFNSRLDIQVLSYIRTRDGFLTAMHDVLRHEGDGYSVPTFNPGSNRDQVGLLRLVNVGDEDAEVRITGTDDMGNASASEVRVSIPEYGAYTIPAAELESGSSGLEGSLGDGIGKWRLRVESTASPEQLLAMSLLESPTGHLTNLSTIPSAQDDGSHTVLLFPSAAHSTGLQGFVRVINRSNEAGEVTISAFDQSERQYSPITLSLEPRHVAHFNSDDLEQGNPEKGLSGGVGAGEGDWRLVLSSDLDIDVLSYIRTPDGFLTALHDTVPSDDSGHEVVTFNPGSNLNQVSMLRLFNPGQEVAMVAVRGIDDAGQSSDASVSLSIPAGAVRSFTAADLEAQDNGSDLPGELGDGTGKWRLLITSDEPLVVMSLIKSPTGHLANISTAPEPVYGAAAGQESGRMVHLPSGAPLPEMVDMPAGEFPMGCNYRRFPTAYRWCERTSPRHTVTISEPFAMSKYEVTFAQWDACVAGGGCYGYRPDDKDMYRDEGWGRGDRPVINVNWYDARSYVAWLSAVTGDNYRLPSEAEWEYAAVAGSPDDYFDHEDPTTCAGDVCAGNFDGEGDGYEYTAPVGSFPANPWGLHDMAGNVSEWTLDCWKKDYRETPVDGSAQTTGDCNHRVTRGTNYGHGRGHSVFPPHQRYLLLSGIRYPHRGFRVVRVF